MTPQLSIVVCTHNRSELLKKCLESLVNQTYSSIEIIVVDNNSTDNTKEVVAQFPKVKYYHESRIGLSYARNTGYENAIGSYIAYIDDDAYASPNWCELIQKNIDMYQFDVCGGKILPYYEHKRPFWFDDRLEIRNYGKKGFVPKDKIRYGFPGSNIILKKVHIQAFGGFNPELGMKGNKIGLGEETSLCLKIAERYSKFYHDPDLIVYHFTPRKNTTLWYRIVRNYAAGASALLIHNKSIFQILKIMATLSVLIFLLPLSLILVNPYFFVRSLQRISYRVGFIINVIDKHFLRARS